MFHATCVATPVQDKLQRKLHRVIAPLMTHYLDVVFCLVQLPDCAILAVENTEPSDVCMGRKAVPSSLESNSVDDLETSERNSNELITI
jgi:hypothetical protein